MLHFTFLFFFKVQRIEKSLKSDILHVEIFPNDLSFVITGARITVHSHAKPYKARRVTRSN